MELPQPYRKFSQRSSFYGIFCINAWRLSLGPDTISGPVTGALLIPFQVLQRRDFVSLYAQILTLLFFPSGSELGVLSVLFVNGISAFSGCRAAPGLLRSDPKLYPLQHTHTHTQTSRKVCLCLSAELFSNCVYIPNSRAACPYSQGRCVRLFRSCHLAPTRCTTTNGYTNWRRPFHNAKGYSLELFFLPLKNVFKEFNFGILHLCVINS